jgi:hypothetical protein
MILQIVKKDWRLLWPFVIGLALLQGVAEWARYGRHVLGGLGASQPLDIAVLLGWIALVAAVVHQDVVPGTRQDWLTRPIKRLDLLAAKLVFVLALVHGPVFLANTVDVLAAGFSLPQALAAATARGVSLFATVTVPVFVLAAVTRNMLELIVAAIVVSLLSELAPVLLSGSTGTPCGATCQTSIEWITTLVRLAVLVAGAGVVLGLQYLKRGTAWARVALAVATVTVGLTSQLPWGLAFALQQRSTGAPAVPSNVSIELDLARGRVAAPDVLSPDEADTLRARASLMGEASDVELRGRVLFRETQGTTLALPLTITRGQNGDVLWADRVEARLVNAAGRLVYRGRGDALEVHAETEDVQALFVPSYVFDRHRDDALELQLDYALTSLEADGELTMPAAGGEARFASNERCTTAPLRNRPAVRMRCLTLHRPSCYIVEAENRASGARFGRRLICDPDYSRFQLGVGLFGSFEIDVPFPNDARLEDWIVRYSPYAPREHFTRRTTAPQLRLADWTDEPR